ncbi:FAD-dependent oxidoreductase [Enhygromyxa salina]|uniref:FAD-dependent oxidoreductase n=1 Tax=Enhygromyxa salina TaxID=215803 RepID=UPI0015E71479|nr:FAD-dependent oxidoreductase [Enhygromyxa salina]
MRSFDVAVIGGGIAGLCFARHLLRARPSTTVAIIDRRRLPADPTQRAVGESTSEIAAWYLARRLGLRDLLERDHVIKFGLRFWLRDPADPAAIERRVEFGPMSVPPLMLERGATVTPPLEPHAYQLHRGRLEAALARMLEADGAELLGATEVVGVTVSRTFSEVELRRDGETSSLRCRFIVDASATGELTRTHLGPRARERQLPHELAAAWWWVEARLDPASWADAAVNARCSPELRWRSTHHFVGRHYWSWVIPLSDGSTSVGIVADAASLDVDDPAPLADQLRAVLEREEPQLTAKLADHPNTSSRAIAARPRARCFDAPLQDRWLVTGAALAFMDPLYSPAHDLTALVHELAVPAIVAELDGTPTSEQSRAQINASVARIVDYYATIYLDGWPVLATAKLAAIKITWDQLSYFGWLCPLVMSQRLRDPLTMQRLRPHGERVHLLNERVQALLRRWVRLRPGSDQPSASGREIDLGRLRTVMDRFLALESLAIGDTAITLEQLERHTARAVELLEGLALAILERACVDLGLDLPSGPLDPYCVGLDPERWGADGLFGTRRARDHSAEARADLDYLWGEQ